MSMERHTVAFPGLGIEPFQLDRVAFTIPGIDWPVYWYGILFALAFLLAILYISKRAPVFGLDPDRALDVVLGGALGGIVVYLTDLAAVGFGTTVLPGIALADPADNGYINYIIAHGIAIAGGFIMTLVLGKFMDQTQTETAETGAGQPVQTETDRRETEAAVQEQGMPEEEIFFGYADGQLIAMEDVRDDTFANKVLGDGVAVIPSDGKVYAPTDGTVLSVFDTKHAVCFASGGGTEILIHIGVDTVNLQGKHFTAHVKDGDQVKRGQLLVEFDREQIEKAGYDTVIPMIFTDLPDELTLDKAAPCRMTRDTQAVVVRRCGDYDVKGGIGNG